MGPRNQFQGMDSASLCSLAGLYDNPLPLWFLAPIASLKIPALGIIWRALRLEVSEYNIYSTNKFQTTFAGGGGGWVGRGVNLWLWIARRKTLKTFVPITSKNSRIRPQICLTCELGLPIEFTKHTTYWKCFPAKRAYKVSQPLFQNLWTLFTFTLN